MERFLYHSGWYRKYQILQVLKRLVKIFLQHFQNLLQEMGNFCKLFQKENYLLLSCNMQYDERSWKTKSLIALSSIYGIEFLEDNLEVARSRMFLYYLAQYEQIFSTTLTSRSDIYKSAYYLIHKNIVRGNTLTQRHPVTDEPIWFNEWQLFKGHSSLVRLGKKSLKLENAQYQVLNP